MQRARATTNCGFLYIAQGVGSVHGSPIAAVIFEQTGGRLQVFYTIIARGMVTGTPSHFALKGLRQRILAPE